MILNLEAVEFHNKQQALVLLASYSEVFYIKASHLRIGIVTNEFRGRSLSITIVRTAPVCRRLQRPARANVPMLVC